MIDAPENVQVSIPVLQLAEGAPLTGDDATPIFCTAAASPRAAFLWRQLPSQQIVAHGPRLVFYGNTSSTSSTSSNGDVRVGGTEAGRTARHSAHRELAGNYSCEASNRHGAQSAPFTLEVLRKSIEVLRVHAIRTVLEHWRPA